MRHCIFTFASVLLPITLIAFTSEEAYHISEDMITRYVTSNEWRDNIVDAPSGDESDLGDEGVEIEFPDADSLFNCEFPPHSAAAGLSSAERENAFNQFLFDLSRTNKADVSTRYEATASSALVFCSELKYARGFEAATGLLARVEAPCRQTAYTTMRNLAYPSPSVSDYIYTILTNQENYSSFNRNALFNDYAARLSDLQNLNALTVTNGISMLCRAAPYVRSKISLDKLLCKRIPEYAFSSNRLAYAISVLEMKTATLIEINHFTSATNEVLSSGISHSVMDLP